MPRQPLDSASPARTARRATLSDAGAAASGWLRAQGSPWLGAAWLALALASLGGVLAPFDARLFDTLVRLVHAEPASSVAVVHHPPGASPAALADTFRRLGARDVLALPPDALATHAAVASPRDDGACQPRPADGIVRSLPLRDRTGAPCPLARLLLAAGLDIPAGRELAADWSARTATSIPRLDAATPLGPAAAAAAVDGRLVLLAPSPAVAVHATPLLPGDGLIEPGVLYALALDAVVRGRAIHPAPRGADLLAAALVALLLTLALARASYRATLAIGLMAALPTLAAFALLLHVGRVHVPATAALLAIGGFALRTVLRRNRALGDTLVDLDHRLTGLVHQPLREGFEADTGAIWEQANRFVTQFFDLRRSLMLELPMGATHMRPVASFGCSERDIIEKRRDYRRAPYSTALARELPTEPSRPFLPAEDGVLDFIAPLTAADQLVGFWAFSVSATPGAQTEALALEAARYANELAKVILRAGNTGETVDAGVRRWPTLSRLRARLLDGATQAREQLAAHRDVFSAVGHPIAVADLFGRVQFANPRFEAFAEATGEPLLAMSVTNMLEQLCGQPPATAKETLRHAVLGDGETATLPVRLPDAEARVLIVRPILRRAPEPGVPSSPFDLLGLIVEIVPDTRHVEDAARLLRAAGEHVRRMESRLDVLARTVERLDVDEGAKERLSDLLAQGLNDSRALKQQIDAADELDSTPSAVAIATLLRRARQANAAAARDKDVGIRLGGRLDARAATREKPLERVLAEVVALLVDDAAPGSSIEIACSVPDGSSVALRMSNEGYGMPPWHVEETMRAGRATAALADASPLERVAHAAAELDATVAFAVTSELGRGYVVAITLPRAH